MAADMSLFGMHIVLISPGRVGHRRAVGPFKTGEAAEAWIADNQPRRGAIRLLLEAQDTYAPEPSASQRAGAAIGAFLRGDVEMFGPYVTLRMAEGIFEISRAGGHQAGRADLTCRTLKRARQMARNLEREGAR